MGINNSIYIIQVLKKRLSCNTLQIEAQEWQNRVLKTRPRKLQKPIEPLFQSSIEISQYHVRKLYTIIMQTGYSQLPRLHFFTRNFKWKHKKKENERRNKPKSSIAFSMQAHNCNKAVENEWFPCSHCILVSKRERP